jgi:internalin A
MKSTYELFLAAFEQLRRKSPKKYELPSGASEEKIFSVETKIGIVFPDELRELLLRHDGEIMPQENLGIGILFGYQFIGLDKIEHIYDLSVAVNEIHKNEDSDFFNFQSVPRGCVKPDFFNPMWLPFAGFYDGAHLALDFDPGPNGVVGQVINFGRDDMTRFQLAKDFKDLLIKINESYQMQRNHYVYEGSDWSLYGYLLESQKQGGF